MRIEQVTAGALGGPKMDPRRYANPSLQVEKSQQEVVPFGKRNKLDGDAVPEAMRDKRQRHPVSGGFATDRFWSNP